MSKFTQARTGRNIKHAVDLFHNRKTLGHMLREVWNRNYRMSFFTTIAIIAGIVYVLFPFDIITDFLPFLGWLDDGFVIFLVIKRLQKETQRFIRFKAMERKNKGLQ